MTVYGLISTNVTISLHEGLVGISRVDEKQTGSFISRHL